jgi:hypothetical protein
MADTSSPAAPGESVHTGSEATIASSPVEPSSPAHSDVAASPSEAIKGDSKETLLEAVMKAVQPADDADEEKPSAEAPSTSEEASSSSEPDGKAGEGDKGPDLSKDPSPEELAAYKKGTRERIEKLLTERNHFRVEAEVTQTLRNFLVTNDIAREDFQLTLDLAAAMRRGDFKSFLEGVGPYVQLATQALGITLPPDLQSEVQTGRVTFDAAAQMSRDRYARALAEQRATRATQVVNTRETAAQQQHLSRSIENAVSAWEQGIRQTDPDYGRKEETVRNFLWSVVQERGAPRSEAHAVEIAREAYARANKTFQQFAPQPKPTRAVPSSINRAASGARPEPRSLMEAAELGLARARGA